MTKRACLLLVLPWTAGCAAGSDDQPVVDDGTYAAPPVHQDAGASSDGAPRWDTGGSGGDADPSQDAGDTDASGGDAGGGSSFACGFQTCTSPLEFCETTMSLNKKISSCKALPAGCNGTPTCACVLASKPCIGSPSCADKGGDVTVVCFGGL